MQGLCARVSEKEIERVRDESDCYDYNISWTRQPDYLILWLIEKKRKAIFIVIEYSSLCKFF